MKPIVAMGAASVASALLAIAVAGLPAAAAVLLGMLAPLVAVSASWWMTERAYRRDPQRLSAMMIGAFGVKMLFFGVYVAVIVGVVGVRTVPFVASFTGYFVALYVTEALLMRRLFAGG
jgi:hypothetical protein